MIRIFQLCLLVGILIWGACDWAKENQVDTFPKDDVIIPFDSINDLVFTWNSKNNYDYQRFRLYRLDTALVTDIERSYTYNLVMDEAITNKSSFSLKSKDISQIKGGHHYVWRVSAQKELSKCLTLIASHSFIVTKSRSNEAARELELAAPSLAIPPQPVEPDIICDTIYQYPGCTNAMTINCTGGNGPIIHIVTLEDKDFLSNNFQLRSKNGSKVRNCIDHINADSFSFYFRFFMEVPCDKREVLDTDKINLYLFTGPNDALVSNIVYDVTLNETTKTQGMPINIIPNAYKQGCAGYCENSSICRAVVEIEGTVPISKFNNGSPYPHHFVFNLGSSSSHAHSTVNGVHNDTLIIDSCGQNSLSLAYFQCIDDLGDNVHESKHNVIIPVNFCP